MSRADRVAERLAGKDVDRCWSPTGPNLRYLTGFTGSNGMAVVGARRAPLRDRLPLRRAGRGRGAGLRPRAGAAGLHRRARVGLAGGRADARLRGRPRVGAGAPAAARACSRSGSRSRPPAASWRPSGRSRSRGRSSGSPRRRRSSTRSTTGCASRGSSGARSARSRSRSSTRCAGAARPDPSFPSIVASGPRGALPHASPGDEAIERGTLVTLDMGVVLDGYCSDCTRTWATGELPDELAEIYALTLRAQVAALDAVRPGPRGARSTRWRAT